MPNDNTEGRVLADLRATAAALDPGTRLPSVRELTARHRASPVTVQQAITRLAAEGLVEPRPGRGTFVAPASSAAEARRSLDADLSWQEVALGAQTIDSGGLDTLLALPPDGAIPLSTGYLEPALQPTAALSAAMTRAARRPGAWDRIAVEGLPELRAWFAAQTGGTVGAHDVVISPGGQSLLATAFRALGTPGDPVLVESPTYLGALAAARSAGLRPVPLPTDTDGVRPDHLADTLQRTGARLVYLQPTFANPHGAVLTADRRAAVLDAVHAAGAFVVEDDCARVLALDAEPPPPLITGDRHGHVVHLRSLTKLAAPGLRIAAMCARGPAGARLRAARIVDDFFVSGPLQQAALELVVSPAWRRHLKLLGGALRERRDALAAAVADDLPGARLRSLPGGGLHLWVTLPDGIDERATVAAAGATGVIVSPGRPWFCAQPPCGHLRLTFAGAPPERLGEGVRRLAEAVPALGQAPRG